MPNKVWKEHDVCINNPLKSIFQIHLNVLENSWNVNQQYLFTFPPCIKVLVWGRGLVLEWDLYWWLAWFSNLYTKPK
jgi:hypothetical protein